MLMVIKSCPGTMERKLVHRCGSEPENYVYLTKKRQPAPLNVNASSAPGWFNSRRSYRSVAYRTWEVGSARKLMSGSYSDHALDGGIGGIPVTSLQEDGLLSLDEVEPGERFEPRYPSTSRCVTATQAKEFLTANGHTRKRCMSSDATDLEAVYYPSAVSPLCGRRSTKSTPSASPFRIMSWKSSHHHDHQNKNYCNGNLATSQKSFDNYMTHGHSNGTLPQLGTASSPHKTPPTPSKFLRFSPASSPSPKRSALIGGGRRLLRYIFKTESLKSNWLGNETSFDSDDGTSTLDETVSSDETEQNLVERNKKMTNGSAHSKWSTTSLLHNNSHRDQNNHVTKTEHKVSFRLVRSMGDEKDAIGGSPRFQKFDVNGNDPLSSSYFCTSNESLTLVQWEPCCQRSSFSGQTGFQGSSPYSDHNFSLAYCQKFDQLEQSANQSAPFSSWNAALEHLKHELEFLRRKDNVIMSQLQSAEEGLAQLNLKDSKEKLSHSFHAGDVVKHTLPPLPMAFLRSMKS